MPILRELIQEIQNRPRIFDFRPKPAVAPQKNKESAGANMVEEEPYLVFKDNGHQYPISRPEYENVTSPADFRQAVVEQGIQKSRSFIDKKAAELTANNTGDRLIDSPPEGGNAPAYLPNPSGFRDKTYFR